MWAVIGVWDIAPEKIDELRAQVPLMASSKVGTPGFVHGTWTLDGHMIQVYADEANARRYHDDMLARGFTDQPGVRCVVWAVAEVGAESQV
ncbi:hypothetical protein [Amycolatopsis sp. WQ 127309]|uniref:hypothetical protein n=1 Tax=Amycolatopsis sp. WQ 127309 TaxID=2932773 RepID=UPI001FF67F91|nr:hypothetical protein [Amycolatopsis sp. WQ 127309]UOZ04311.1 hypothetical protein MUY22_36530 [Amycolatopsis sp. WQ 127309]